MKHLAVLIAGLSIATASLDAQATTGVPDSHRPPPGMCRIWIDGVPPAHQPAPTDCATAIRKRPQNARVVFGNEPAGVQRGFAAPQRIAPTATPAQTPNAVVAPESRPRPDNDRAAQRQREMQEQERQRAAQQQQAEEEKRARRVQPPAPRATPPKSAPAPRPRVEKSPPRQSPRPSHQPSSGRRPS